LENKELLLMGDLNCDVSKFPPDAHTRRLQFLSCVYQLEQLINEPTRVTRTSATLIDLIFTNKKENIAKSGVIHLGISDHSLIFAVRKFFTPKSRQNVRYVRNFKLKISMLRTFLMIYHRCHGKMWHNMKIQTLVGNYMEILLLANT
jgi:hypothetical protein